MTRVRVLPYGDRALLVEVDDPLAVVRLRDGLASERNPGITNLVPAARTVLVEYDPAAIDPDDIALLAWNRLEPDRMRMPMTLNPIVIGVHYDGEDLATVADITGLSVDEIVRRHQTPHYTVQFCGFSPGFAYLVGLDAALHVPRLATPRTSVPAGSVAIAGEYTGVYPRASPGGWRLIGRTDVTLFSVARNPPALLTPGALVRFVAQ